VFAVLSASKPLIGLTTYRQRSQTGVWDVEAAFLPAEYFDAVNRAGGTAVLIPPQDIDPAAAERILSGLDGLVICGGRDVDASLYGQVAGEHNDKPDTRRDALELALYDVAIAQGIPFLGICRGQQVLNVHQGGTLIQHLPDVVGSNKYQLGNANFTITQVDVLDKNLLSKSLGNDAKVTAALYHHQAIDKVGDGLVVVARSEDGIVEGVELVGHPFGLAVQWHPEHTPEDNRLFEALVEAANTYRSNR
jgi:putative glutamine amidotransferase